MLVLSAFFFSSRRRHTRYWRDWSSDVCSSDLLGARLLQGMGAAAIPVLGMAIVSARYDGAVRTTALGRVAGTAAAVSALGPLTGGLVADLAGWRAVVVLPALGLLVVPRSEEHTSELQSRQYLVCR